MAFLVGWIHKLSSKKKNNMDEKAVIEKADMLFLQRNYQQVYETLKASKFDSNVEILWRLSRVLYKIAQRQNEENERNKYLKDAYFTLNKALEIKEDDANVHKWMAVIIAAIAKNEGITEKVKYLEQQKVHLTRSLELNPNDYAVLHMLGNWCYGISSFSFLQRILLRFIFAEPPKSSYEEAYNYFLKAEELQSKFYIPNVYMLGKACYLLNQYYKARYYFDLAASLTPQSQYEQRCQEEAKDMISKLDMFNLTGADFNDFSS